MPTIDIIINPDGSVTVEASGVVGPDCKALTAKLEAALGETVSDTKKPEFDAAPAVATQKAKA